MSRWQWLKWVGLVATVAALAAGATVVLAMEVAGPSGLDSQPQIGPPPAQEVQEQPWLGIVGLPWPAAEGVAVLRVIEDGPADQAGLKRGDVITALDGQPVRQVRDLREALRERSVGETVILGVIRGGVREPDKEPTSIAVTLGARPDKEVLSRARQDRHGRFERFLGGEFRYRNRAGEVVTVAIDAGQVKRIADREMVVTLNSGEERSYLLGEETRLLPRLKEGDAVVVISVDGEVKAVHRVGAPGWPWLWRPHHLPRAWFFLDERGHCPPFELDGRWLDP